MKKISLPTADELQARLAAIQPAQFGRGWKTGFLDQHAEPVLAALAKHSYDDVAKAIREAGAPIATATLSNWAKARRSTHGGVPTVQPERRESRPLVRKRTATESITSLFSHVDSVTAHGPLLEGTENLAPTVAPQGAS